MLVGGGKLILLAFIRISAMCPYLDSVIVDTSESLLLVYTYAGNHVVHCIFRRWSITGCNLYHVQLSLDIS